MSSHETIGWNVQDNFVKDRMIDNSLTHKFIPSSKIRRRTKALNAKIKKYCAVKDYKQYVKLKTNTVRNLIEDTDTDNSDNLSDTDYDIIYSSLIQTKSSVDDSERYIFTEEDSKGFKTTSTRTNTKRKEKNIIKNTTSKRKPVQAKCNTSASKKRISIGWQKVTKKNKDISHLSNNQACINNEENILENNNYDYLKAQSNNQSLSLQFDSQNSTTSSIIKSVNEDMRERCIDSNTVVNESNSQDSTISNEIKPGESEIQDYKEQNAVTDKSNTKLDSQNPPDSLSKYQASSSKSISLRNIECSDNEVSSVIKLKNNRNKLAEVGNKNLINSKNYSNAYESQKSKLLKNVRRNLIPVLEEADLMNKNIEKDKSEEDRLNYDQLLVPTTSSTKHNIPIKNLSPYTSSLDQQKDSGFDKDSQDKFDKIEQGDIRSLANLDIAGKMLVSPQQSEKIAEVETIASENFKEDINNDNLEKQDSKEEKEFSREEKEEENSSQFNPIDKDINQEVSLTNQENKTKFVKAKEDIEKQQSLKEDNAKNVHSKSCENILKEQDSREEESFKGKVRNSLQLNEVDKDVKIYPLNHEDKNDLLNQSLCSYNKTYSTEPEDSCDIQKQRSLFPKEDHAKDVYSKSCNNILKEQDSKKEESFEEEITDFFQSNQIDKDTEIYSINHQDKRHSMKLEDSCNIEKQQLLPKITYSEIINKKYMIINKQNNISIEKNDINSQEEMSKAEESDNNVSITLETDNEEDNANYISPETKKRLQQQARLNLVVSSDSSQSDDEYITIETSRKHNDDSDTSCCNKDMFENDEINREKINTDISCSKDSSIRSKEATSVPTKEIVKVDSPNVKNKTRKQADNTVLLTSCTYENNNSSKSAANKNSLKEIQYCGNVYNDDDNQNESIEDESFQSRVSEGNVSCISEESKNQFSRNKSLLDKENFCDKSDQSEDRMSDCTSKLGTRCKPRDEQNKTKRSNVHLDIPCHYRPYNLQQLVEDEKLFVETIPAGFTLADLSEDDEAFILNVPNKVLQCNLQSQLLSLKEKTIKFGENKYRIVRRKVGTVSCIFATGKQRRPYKTVNIKEISTITVRERLPHCSRKSDVSNSYDTVISPESESSKINNRQTKKASSKMLKVDCNKRKRSSSDFETEQFATKKGRLKLIHS